MSRTYKYRQRYWYRRVRGRKRALLNNARKKSIPPDPWDDIPVDNQCSVAEKVALGLHKKGWSNEKIAKRISWKFKIHYLRVWDDIIPDKPFDDWWGCECEECKRKNDAWREWFGTVTVYSMDEVLRRHGLEDDDETQTEMEEGA